MSNFLSTASSLDAPAPSRRLDAGMTLLAVILPTYNYTIQVGGSVFGFHEYNSGTVLIVGPWYWEVPFSASQGLLLVGGLLMCLNGLMYLLGRRLVRPA
jgi:hypothetical protein